MVAMRDGVDPQELTESDEEVEEPADVEGDVGDELAVLPVRLHGDPDVDRVPHSAAATHHDGFVPLVACLLPPSVPDESSPA